MLTEVALWYFSLRHLSKHVFVFITTQPRPSALSHEPLTYSFALFISL